MKNYGKIISYFFPLRKGITGKAPVNKSYFVLTTVIELYSRLVLTCVSTLKMLPFEELRNLHSTGSWLWIPVLIYASVCMVFMLLNSMILSLSTRIFSTSSWREADVQVPISSLSGPVTRLKEMAQSWVGEVYVGYQEQAFHSKSGWTLEQVP